jgi:Fic family protein
MAELPILHSHRPEYGWVERLDRLREAYQAMVVSDPVRATSDTVSIDRALVYHSLRLRGAEVTQEGVSADSTNPEVAGALAAVSRVRRAAENDEELTLDLLLEINRLVDPGKGGRWRVGPPVAAYQGHTPPPADGLPALIENATEWFLATSFREELRPVERASLALVRICDLQPFPSSNELTARVASSLFLLRDGFVPLVVREEFEGEYRKALLHAMHMDTMPVVELIAKCVARTYDDLLGWNVHELVD